jgi:hypothetical protein
MCIIVVKPAGEKLPDENILTQCFENNPDGAGYMYRDKGQVQIRKGFMSVDSLIESLLCSEEDIGLTQRDLCIHFRLATHGNIIPGCTHPFPVSNNLNDLTALVISTNAGIAHNGILYKYAPRVKGMASDTMMFIRAMVENGYEDKKHFMIRNGSGQNFCLMTRDHIFIQGDFTYSQGIYYSNLSYLLSYD